MFYFGKCDWEFGTVLPVYGSTPCPDAFSYFTYPVGYPGDAPLGGVGSMNRTVQT